jgi:dienelactone hydrolase
MASLRKGVAGLILLPALLAGGPAPAPPRAPRYPDHSKLLVLLDAEGKERRIETAADWERRREHILLSMEEVMGERGEAAEARARPAPEFRDEEPPVESGSYTRRKISYLAEPGDRVPAFLLIPRESGKRPAVLCLHQTTPGGKAEPVGLGGKKSLRYAADLAERGYVALAPDYPNFGEHRFDPYSHGYSSGTMKAIRDNVRALDLLQSLPEVDPGRLGCIGHSLGGHNAIFTAAFDRRIKAVVSSCGFTAFGRYYGGDLTGWSSKTYMPRIPSYGGWRAMPFDFHEVVGALAPRAFLAVAPLRDSNFDVGGVREVLESAREVYRLLGAEDRLAADFPDEAHDFPAGSREKAHAFLDRWLAGVPVPGKPAGSPPGAGKGGRG